jgi:hypothetical protein
VLEPNQWRDLGERGQEGRKGYDSLTSGSHMSCTSKGFKFRAIARVELKIRVLKS